MDVFLINSVLVGEGHVIIMFFIHAMESFEIIDYRVEIGYPLMICVNYVLWIYVDAMADKCYTRMLIR